MDWLSPSPTSASISPHQRLFHRPLHFRCDIQNPSAMIPVALDRWEPSAPAGGHPPECRDRPNKPGRPVPFRHLGILQRLKSRFRSIPDAECSLTRISRLRSMSRSASVSPGSTSTTWKKLCGPLTVASMNVRGSGSKVDPCSSRIVSGSGGTLQCALTDVPESPISFLRLNIRTTWKHLLQWDMPASCSFPSSHGDHERPFSPSSDRLPSRFHHRVAIRRNNQNIRTYPLRQGSILNPDIVPVYRILPPGAWDGHPPPWSGSLRHPRKAAFCLITLLRPRLIHIKLFSII